MQRPGPQLYRDVRAAFVSRDSSLHAWCAKRGVTQANARLALLGAWDGPKARQLRTEILRSVDMKTQEGRDVRANVA